MADPGKEGVHIHVDFFLSLQNNICIRKLLVISGVVGGVQPLHPPCGADTLQTLFVGPRQTIPFFRAKWSKSIPQPSKINLFLNLVSK